MKATDEFYIGWEDRAPTAVGSWVRRTVAGLFLLAIALGIVLSLSQRTIGSSVFEWGRIKEFTGVLKSRPYPHLLVPRPGAKDGQAAFSSYYLVKPFKFGLDPETADTFHGQSVHLRGTLIYWGNQTMIEIVDGSIRASKEASRPAVPGAHSPAVGENDSAGATPAMPIRLGRQTLTGEIVDSKCYLGVMNPGALTPHRACAIRCISGGIPPVLLVRQLHGPPLYLLLVSKDGKAVNKQVLDLVAEPVEITGEVERQGDLLVLRADPATYRRSPR